MVPVGSGPRARMRRTAPKLWRRLNAAVYPPPPSPVSRDSNTPPFATGDSDSVRPNPCLPLCELKVGPRTRNNLRASIQVLFNYAISREYLEKDNDEMDAVPLAKDKGGEIEIFTPKEMAELLAVASAEQLPFMAISAFAGVRHAEIQRLDWKHVNQAAGIIEIRAGAAKTASRRVIPILPNPAAWLKPHWQEAGPICQYAYMADEFGDLARRATAERKKKKADAPDFKWKHNALRHSFISYRVAKTQDVAKVSLEAGNSPQMIFKHYRELVQAKDAKAWFAIMPAGR